MPFPEDPNLACNVRICGRERLLREIRELVDKVKQLKEEYGNVKNHLDKGRTSELLDAIAKYTPANQLKDELIGSSPLTDAVLEALLNRGVPLPPQVFKEIIIPNSPVSWKIYPLLEKKFSTLPPSITKELRFAQSRDLPYRTLTRIEGDIDANETERQMILQDRVQYYFENDSIPEALVLLENEDNKEVKQTLVGKYLEMMDYTRATDKLATLPRETQEDLDIIDYYTLLVGLGKDGKTIWDMEEVQMDKVRVIATHCPTTAVSLNAQVLLKKVMDEEFVPCQENAASRLESNSLAQKFPTEPSDKNNSMDGKEVFLEQNYPNPGSDKIMISFRIPGDMNAELKIYNYNGMFLENHPATGEAGSVVLNSEKWKQGIYFYSLFANGENISGFKKLILIK